MHWAAFTLVFVTSFCYASHCPDPRLHQAVIGGDTINGSVVLQQKPLKFAQVQLFSSSGKTAWVGATDKDGEFRITPLPHDTYRLEVLGWGSTTVRLDPKLDDPPDMQTTFWLVELMDRECVGTGLLMD